MRQAVAAAFAGNGGNRSAIARNAGVGEPPEDDPTAPDQAQQEPPDHPTETDHDGE